jgi:dynein heavy chain 1
MRSQSEYKLADSVLGEATISKLRKMRTTDDDEDGVGSSAASGGRPAWMNALKAHAEEWLAVLPKVPPLLGTPCRS